MKTTCRDEVVMRWCEEAEACRRADAVARTLLRYYQEDVAERETGHVVDRHGTHQTVCDFHADHARALDDFAWRFPGLEWRDFADQETLEAIEESRP